LALILNIESSTNICSVCLAKDGEVITYKENDEANVHSSLLSVFIEQLFSNTSYKFDDVEAIGISKGPGSYTGLRIGVSVAKGIAYGLNIPLLGISTLQHMTVGAQEITGNDEALYAPMLDAKRMEVYTAILNKEQEYVMNPTSIIVDKDLFCNYRKENTIYLFGNGLVKSMDVLKDQYNLLFLSDFQISSIHMCTLAEYAFTNKQFESFAYFTPMYMKEFIPNRNKKGG